ncbi:hypothetical protein NTE_02039 [Candidatus Nitrososphaera evergladensis SR1]|uniref:Uncharacterized protein n=1 Tax=Candidatus Nitrososphaera evergladensis SR1 TaxID=1459636 RepID=A0A075MRB3_9ARCH|nr:hypothetical protein [Candidatus Nitrososphaera evergladensis]AIF84096.1 hypothetical protein NTE_02039 [Candidatus Nitrososphaera evergladensis SR1]
MFHRIAQKTASLVAKHPQITMMAVSVGAALVLGAIVASLDGGQAWASSSSSSPPHKCPVLPRCINF